MTRKLLVLLILPLLCNGQSYVDNLQKEVEVGTFLSTSGQNPFWLRSNQYGIIPLESQGITVRARIGTKQSVLNSSNRFNKKDSLDRSLNWKGFKFDYAVEAVANVGQVGQLLLPEAYASVKWKIFELYAGRRREIIGLVDTTLTSGSYIWSGNSLPIPKIQLSTQGYIPVIGNGFVAINAGISHGWFSDNGIVENYYLHQKWLYGKIGKKRLQVYGGLNHQAQWGGYSETLKGITNVRYPPTIDGYLAPYPLYSYQFVLIPFLQKFKNIDEAKVPGYDGGLAIGNQLGSVDIGATWNTEEALFLFYHQHPYDFARSISRLNNLEDGNNGLSIYFKNKETIKKVLIEYLSTVSQGRYRFGKENESNSGEFDNYFSHGQYKGWYYEDKIMGTPFIQINGVGGYKRTNNRVRAFSFAVEGIFKNINYAGRYSYARSLGTYGELVNLKQSYLLIDLSKKIKTNQRVALKIAADIGSIENKNGLGIWTSYQVLL
jgi:hypothetical protein